MVDLDPQALYAKGLSPADVTAAINAQNLILPAGTRRSATASTTCGSTAARRCWKRSTTCRSSRSTAPPSTMRDVAQVRDGYAVQTNIVRRTARARRLLTILKTGSASTLDIVKRVREALPRIEATLPAGAEDRACSSTSRCSSGRPIDGVLTEGADRGRPHRR